MRSMRGCIPPNAGDDHGGLEPALVKQGWPAGSLTLQDPHMQHFRPPRSEESTAECPTVPDHPGKQAASGGELIAPVLSSIAPRTFFGSNRFGREANRVHALRAVCCRRGYGHPDPCPLESTQRQDVLSPIEGIGRRLEAANTWPIPSRSRLSIWPAPLSQSCKYQSCLSISAKQSLLSKLAYLPRAHSG
jgi:hypothetical protein